MTLATSNALKELGISPAWLGYEYLRMGIELVMLDPTLSHKITTKLYPKIAKAYQTTPSRVERAMRHAIEEGWFRGSSQKQKALFGYTVSSRSGKPTNSEFIATVADYLLMMEGVEQ